MLFICICFPRSTFDDSFIALFNLILFPISSHFQLLLAYDALEAGRSEKEVVLSATWPSVVSVGTVGSLRWHIWASLPLCILRWLVLRAV